MIAFFYSTGQDLRAGDRIKYHDEAGQVEFVIATATGDPSFDWYLGEFPGGGVMINTEGFGSVFIRAENIEENLVFISRSP